MRAQAIQSISQQTPAEMFWDAPAGPLPIPYIPPAITLGNAESVGIRFNVMPSREVAETLHIRQYRIWDSYAEAIFDRSYSSSMEASPSHLIFLTGLVHTQKIVYLLMAHKLGKPYDPGGREFGKFWPTDLKISLPQMVRKETDLVQRIWITSIRPINERTWSLEIATSFCDKLWIWARSPFFLL